MGCYRYTPMREPPSGSEVRLRFDDPRDLVSVSPNGDTLVIRRVRVLQARLRALEGDTLVLTHPGEYFGAGGNFLLDAGRTIRVARASGIAIDKVDTNAVEAGLAAGVVALTALVVFLYASLISSIN